jgi:hypothetical protein
VRNICPRRASRRPCSRRRRRKRRRDRDVSSWLDGRRVPAAKCASRVVGVRGSCPIRREDCVDFRKLLQ